ncbi:unnamed protein product [Closterium sp. NIES-54]
MEQRDPWRRFHSQWFIWWPCLHSLLLSHFSSSLSALATPSPRPSPSVCMADPVPISASPGGAHGAEGPHTAPASSGVPDGVQRPPGRCALPPARL